MQLPENHKNQYPARTKLAIGITNIIPGKVKIVNLQNNLNTHIITLDPYYQNCQIVRE